MSARSWFRSRLSWRRSLRSWLISLWLTGAGSCPKTTEAAARRKVTPNRYRRRIVTPKPSGYFLCKPEAAQLLEHKLREKVSEKKGVLVGFGAIFLVGLNLGRFGG